MALQCATSTQCLLHPFPSLSLKISPHCLIDKIDDSFSLSANQASFVESPPYFSIRKESRRIARILSRCMWEEEGQQLSNGERVTARNTTPLIMMEFGQSLGQSGWVRYVTFTLDAFFPVTIHAPTWWANVNKTDRRSEIHPKVESS